MQPGRLSCSYLWPGRAVTSVRCRPRGAAGQVSMDASSGFRCSPPGCPALQGMALGPSPLAVSHSAPTHLSQPCPSSIAVGSRFVAHASSARSYLRSCPPRAVPVRCRPTVWWFCFYCGRCIEFVMLLLTYSFTPRTSNRPSPLHNYSTTRYS